MYQFIRTQWNNPQLLSKLLFNQLRIHKYRSTIISTGITSTVLCYAVLYTPYATTSPIGIDTNATDTYRLTNTDSPNQSLAELAKQYIIPDGQLNQQNDMKLIFTDNDTDPLHKQLEILLRNTQSSIIQQIIDIESNALYNETEHNVLYDIYKHDTNNNCTIPSKIDYPTDLVVRSDGSGGGIARVYQNGIIFEKSGVSISIANRMINQRFFIDQQNEHSQLKQLVQSNTIPDTPCPLFTASMSLVLHPRNPMCPTVHANYRYFEIKLPDGKQIWWYGGGSDLTPMYLNNDDAKHFHVSLKSALDRTSDTLYTRYKQWCDDYFFISHRNERRGIGGIFFEDQHYTDKSTLFNMISSCCHIFNQSYFPIIQKHKSDTYTYNNYIFQQYRRGRYVEFNLVYDRGTTYGLTHMPPAMARPDAVLMSLPPTCRFAYNYIAQPDSEEQRTIDVLKKPIQWI